MILSNSGIGAAHLLLDLGELVAGSALVAGGISKLAALDGAAAGILGYQVVPKSLAPPMALVLALAELFVGSGCVLGMPVAAALGVLLLALFSAVGISALLRRLEIDCHCAGVGERLDATTLGRNAAFAIALAAPLLGAPNLLTPAALALPLPHAVALGAVATTCVATLAAWKLLGSIEPRKVRSHA